MITAPFEGLSLVKLKTISPKSSRAFPDTIVSTVGQFSCLLAEYNNSMID